VLIYLASRYSRREELCEYREQLRAAGHHVTSRWLNGEHQALDTNGSELPGTPQQAMTFAADDFGDLMAADVVISFTEPPRSAPNRGGRHVEFGMAIATGKRVLVVGYRENVFHCLPRVEFCETWAVALSVLAGTRGLHCCNSVN